MLATKSPETALQLLGLLKARLGNAVTTFELISAPALRLVLEHLPDESPPFAEAHEWLLLVEATSQAEQSEADDVFHCALTDAYDHGLVIDALLATSETQAKRFWRLREEISDAQTRTGGSVRCDISVPLSAIPAFIEKAVANVLSLEPATRMVVYGHLGDGNVHFNPLRPSTITVSDFVSKFASKITEVVDGLANSLGGSISAEHGVGVSKRDELLSVKSRVELKTAWRIKLALDPKNLLNPGKVLA